ncbi:50S ribosomal protein L22 [Methanimicrococcus stummii]|uniref:Large ribosomal subunit protein uL22 n=1 Tax=Methanimicrococcus stummii TaxID=3028294 RepID=A0AA96ZXU7_9EURY|nr:50S ribosomal protein L22 [Methanimicrococcus sp. Es2]WNY29374.1 50S ribosomal protein L22 [Methanimicrococcus sp. Es2]
MGRLNYAVKADPESTSKATASELHISFKKTREICHHIQGMKLTQAQAFLNDVVVMKKAVPFKRHTDGSGHKKGPMANGKYPVNASVEVLKVLRNAESNAEYKGLEPSRMYVKSIRANRGRVIRGYFPRARGRASPKNTTTVNIEIILSEVL